MIEVVTIKTIQAKLFYNAMNPKPALVGGEPLMPVFEEYHLFLLIFESLEEKRPIRRFLLGPWGEIVSDGVPTKPSTGTGGPLGRNSF